MGIDPPSNNMENSKDESSHVKAVEEGNAGRVEKEQAQMNKDDSAATSNTKKKMAFVIIAGLVIVALVVGLAVGIGKGDDDNSSSYDYSKGDSGTNNDNDSTDMNDSDNSSSTADPNNNDTNSNNPTQSPITTLPDEEFYRSSDFNTSVTLPLYSAKYTETLIDPDHEQFKLLVNNASLFLCKNVLKRNLKVKGFSWAAMGSGSREVGIMESVMDDMATAGAPSTNDQQEPPADATDSLNDYGTNNQEKFVDEGSQLKSDGVYVYAAYGDQIQIFTTTALQKEPFQMTKPEVNCSKDVPYEGPTIFPPPEEVPDNETIPKPETPDTDSSTVGSSGGSDSTSSSSASTKSFILPYYFCPEASVQSLLLTPDRLIAFVSGYQQEVFQKEGIDTSSSSWMSSHILQDYGATRMFVFNTTKIETEGLVLVGTQDMHGYFHSARTVNNIVHAVLISGINTYEPLIQPIEKWNFPDLSPSEYNSIVVEMLDELVPQFTRRITNEIFETDGFPSPEFLKGPSMWSEQVSDDANEEAIIWGDGVMNSYLSINSLDMNEFKNAQDDRKLPIVSSGAFFPSSWVISYANEEMLTLGGQGHQYDASMQAHVPTTFLMGFKFQTNGSAAVPVGKGSVPGYPLNQYSFDQVGNHLRVATTIRNWWVRTTNLFTDGPIVQNAVPETQNQIVVMELQEDSWVKVGQTPNLGKKGETITACRFFDNFAYVVTFLRTDPFYVVDLSKNDVKEIPVPGELSISGFSEYLHPINSEETMLLAIGQEADAEGRVLGLQLTIFNATDPAKPDDIHRHVVEDETDVYTSSSAEWQPHAFRYVPVSPDLGLENSVDGFLIIPLTKYSYKDLQGTGASENFDGYMVYTISILNGIKEHMSIPHADSSTWGYCYSSNYLVDRSFVFDGNVMTTKRHSVELTDLGSKQNIGGFSIVQDSKENCHCWIC
mmetsp:Transcript_1998/g.2800  ORF Transcript_1998/g.2800 Transcript_1998/m.2800 type:complete len:942 (+) Transcript_1998:81-2906(+)